MLVTELDSTMDDSAQRPEAQLERRSELCAARHWGKMHKHHGHHRIHGPHRQGYRLCHSPASPGHDAQDQDGFHGKHHRGHRHGPHHGKHHHGLHHGPRPSDGLHHGHHRGPHHGVHRKPDDGAHPGPRHGTHCHLKEKKDWVDKCHKKFLKKLHKKGDGQCGQDMVLISEELLNFLCSAYNNNNPAGAATTMAANETGIREVMSERANLSEVSAGEENPAVEEATGVNLAEDMSNLQVSKE